MRVHALLAIAATMLETQEKLGSVSFSISCVPAVRARFDRGVALLHDFSYEEAQRQRFGIHQARIRPRQTVRCLHGLAVTAETR
jgi:hypothetical protein